MPAYQVHKIALLVCMAGAGLCLIVHLPFVAVADHPQTNLVVRCCGQTLANDPSSYYSTLNATNVPNILSALSSSLNASSHARSSHLHAFFQCREYLSLANCLACFVAASLLIGRCYPSSHSPLRRVLFGLPEQQQELRLGDSLWPLHTTCEDQMVAANEAVRFSPMVAAAVEGLVREVPKGRRLFAANGLVCGGAVL